MSKSFARLFSILTFVERQFGLTSLSAGERVIFDFIVISVANGRSPTLDDIAEISPTSRATTSRRLASLQESGLVRSDVQDGKTVYLIGANLDGFKPLFYSVFNDLKTKH